MKSFVNFFLQTSHFDLTLRVKRGLSDTSLPGGFTKDYLYLQGYYDVKEFASNHDVLDLFVGKIGIGDVKLVKKIPELVSPIFFPSFLNKA
jgi:hypothetical protein